MGINMNGLPKITRFVLPNLDEYQEGLCVASKMQSLVYSFPVDSKVLHALLTALPTSQYAVYPHHTSTTSNTSRQVFTQPRHINYSKYKIKRLNEPRRNRKLMVLELEHVLCHMAGKPKPDDRSIRRPWFESFFKGTYKNYDIIIWSAADPISTKLMLKQLKILEDKNFKILCCLDSTHTIPHNIKNLGVKFVKPLQLIWYNYPQYNETNTLIIDYNDINFNLDKANGLKIKKYCRDDNREEFELSHLVKYLIYLNNSHTAMNKINFNNFSTY